MALSVGILRELLRSYQAFYAVFESDGIDTVIGPDGEAYCLWDLTYLYDQARVVLPRRQFEAIELCLIHNRKESDAAVQMGVSPTNPVAMYATSGLQKLVAMIDAGVFPRFRAVAAYREVG